MNDIIRKVDSDRDGRIPADKVQIVSQKSRVRPQSGIYALVRARTSQLHFFSPPNLQRPSNDRESQSDRTSAG
jgi:hypothetical protein